MHVLQDYGTTNSIKMFTEALLIFHLTLVNMELRCKNNEKKNSTTEGFSKGQDMHAHISTVLGTS